MVFQKRPQFALVFPVRPDEREAVRLADENLARHFLLAGYHLPCGIFVVEDVIPLVVLRHNRAALVGCVVIIVIAPDEHGIHSLSERVSPLREGRTPCVHDECQLRKRPDFADIAGYDDSANALCGKAPKRLEKGLDRGPVDSHMRIGQNSDLCKRMLRPGDSRRRNRRGQRTKKISS